MSRIGKNPIAVPDSVNVAISSSEVKVNGRKGELSIELHDGITVVNDEKQLRVTRRDDSKPQRSLHGLTRALIANMVHGVEKGFSKLSLLLHQLFEIGLQLGELRQKGQQSNQTNLLSDFSRNGGSQSWKELRQMRLIEPAGCQPRSRSRGTGFAGVTLHGQQMGSG